MIAALGPVMLKLAGERAAGTSLWLADERTIASHVVPTITKAAQAAGRPAPRILAGVPVCLCRDDEVDAAVERTNRVLSEVVDSPNYQRLMEHGDARTIGDVLVCGSEATMEKRLRSFADAGVTDLNARIVPLGRGSRRRSGPRPSAPASSSPRSHRRSAGVTHRTRGAISLRGRSAVRCRSTMPPETNSQISLRRPGRRRAAPRCR